MIWKNTVLYVVFSSMWFNGIDINVLVCYYYALGMKYLISNEKPLFSKGYIYGRKNHVNNLPEDNDA